MTAHNFSKMGYNGFVSGTQRNPFKNKYLNSGPGPGAYVSNQPMNNNSTSLSHNDTTLHSVGNKKSHTYAFNAISREPTVKAKR